MSIVYQGKCYMNVNSIKVNAIWMSIVLKVNAIWMSIVYKSKCYMNVNSM